MYMCIRGFPKNKNKQKKKISQATEKKLSYQSQVWPKMKQKSREKIKETQTEKFTNFATNRLKRQKNKLPVQHYDQHHHHHGQDNIQRHTNMNACISVHG